MGKDENNGNVTWRAFVLGVLLAGVFAWITVIRDNFPPVTYYSANLIPVLPHVMLFLAVLLINPLLKRLRFIRPFCRSELLMVFVMCAVSSGLATFGLSGRLVPIVSGLSNKANNTQQSQWDTSVMPFLNEDYFISGEGTQAAARHLRETTLRYEGAQSRYRSARDLQLMRSELAELESELAEIANISDPELRASRERSINWPHRRAVNMLEKATQAWGRVAKDETPDVVVETYPEKIEALKAEQDRLRQILLELNADAVASVDLVRKGLPSGMRALPGFVYTPGEGLASYMARIQRLRIGTKSRDQLKQAMGGLEEAIRLGSALPPGWGDSIRDAAGLLDGLAEIPALAARDQEQRDTLKALEDEIVLADVEIRRLRHLDRLASQGDLNILGNRVSDLEMANAARRKKAVALSNRIELRYKPLLDVCERVKETRAELLQLSEDAASATAETYPELGARLSKSIADYRLFDASSHRFWLGDAEWGIWLRPISSWLLIAFVGYIVLLSFNTLIHRQWSHHEKLIYPLAEIVTLLVGGNTPDRHGKTLFRSGLFWTGFCMAAGILGWNYLASNDIIPNLPPVKLEFRWVGYMGRGMLRALNSTWFCIIFAVIGLSFLVPSKISFSLWFFEVLYMGLLIVMVALGYGSDRWTLGNVGRAGLGGGAVVVFGVTILWTCRRYLLCAFKPDVLKGLAPDEAKELRTSSILFLGGSLLLMLLVTLSLDVNPVYTFVYYALMLTFTIALVRAVAEGGVLGLSSLSGVFAIIKLVFGSSMAWCTPVVMAPLMLVDGFIVDLKSFIAPTMANALKIREQIRVPRHQFHLAIWASIMVTTLVSVVTLVILSYQHGADNLEGWLNTSTPKWAFGGIKGVVETSGVVKASERGWLFGGAVLMGLLLFSRRRVFGVPHPIGLLMLMNPNMFGFWASIMIGGTIKSLVSKYCTQDQYIAIRRFFIGLVLGHLAAVLFGWQKLNFHWG